MKHRSVINRDFPQPMKLIVLASLSVLCTLPHSSSAQVVHIVEMGGSTITKTAPYYLPQFITIDQGDTVRWVNVSGTHNVNGSVATFVDNPEGFYSGVPANGDYHFDHVFNIPGHYDYHCDSEGHASTQFGTITVLGANGIPDDAREADITIYPDPVGEWMMVEVGARSIKGASILGIDGRIIANKTAFGKGPFRIPMADIPAGNYLLLLIDASGAQHIRFSKE